jgi:hypothetical protein
MESGAEGGDQEEAAKTGSGAVARRSIQLLGRCGSVPKRTEPHWSDQVLQTPPKLKFPSASDEHRVTVLVPYPPHDASPYPCAYASWVKLHGAVVSAARAGVARNAAFARVTVAATRQAARRVFFMDASHN